MYGNQIKHKKVEIIFCLNKQLPARHTHNSHTRRRGRPVRRISKLRDAARCSEGDLLALEAAKAASTTTASAEVATPAAKAASTSAEVAAPVAKATAAATEAAITAIAKAASTATSAEAAITTSRASCSNIGMSAIRIPKTND
jgi:hypothetical protein